MNPFDGYLIPEDFFSEPVLIQNKKKHIFRATAKSTGKTVALKRARTSDGILAEASKLSHEYTILKNLDHPNIPKAYELISSGKLVTLVLEWFEAETLKERITHRNITLDDFFEIAISIVETLQYVHQLGIVHRDINPANILVAKDCRTKLIDFGISTNMQSEQNEKLNLDLIEGTLVYMAPEQTGRTSYTITDSCDLYALGIVFYEMLAGKPPFDSVDPLEVIHFHLSRKPIFLQKTNPNLPFGVCAMIEKLLEKNPDDRYQSEEGLLTDLRILQDHYKQGISTDQFIVASKNQFKRYRETQKLYGREGDVKQLLKSFDALGKSNSSLVLISGYAGIGKSVLVKQIQQPIVEKKAIFIAGKFDQFKRNIPYFSFIEAFNDLIKNILSESDEKINYWKNQLTFVLGENGGLITELLPNLEMIIGKQAPTAKLQPAEHEFRFRTVMLDFIYAFSSPGSPLVIFLDDLHWADLPSLSLIERILITSETDKVLIIGTYRDNEVNEFHPLRMTIQQLKSNSIDVNEIQLNQLNEQTTIQIVADSFEMELSEANELGSLTYKKTNGNPFFINRFLKSLFADKLITYSNGKWNWDKSTIDGLAYADNVIDLMSREIANLPITTREAMKMAAVLGNTFNLNQLALIMGQAQYEIFETLYPALKAGYIVPIDRNYRNISLTLEGVGENWREESEKVTTSFRFMHDRVQQAAYSLISESDRDKVHLHTGRILLKNTPKEKLSDAAFDITGHFTNGLYLVTSAEEKKELAKLFLLAGHKAKDSTSYDLAVIYLSNALKLNADFGWSGDYAMTFDIYITLGESEFLDNDNDKALYYFGELLKYAKTDLEKLKIYYVQSSLYLKLSKTKECLVIGRKAMRLFNIHFPEKPWLIKLKAYWVMGKYFLNFSKNMKRAQELLQQEACKDEQVIEINKFLVDMSTAAYQENQELMLLVVFKNVDQFLEHGVTDSSGWCFSSFAFVTLSVLGLSKKGFSLWDLTAQLSPRTKSESTKVKVDYLLDAMSTHWRRPVDENTDRILETIKKCNLNGFPHYSGYATTNYISKKIASGIPIQTVLDLSTDKVEFLKKVKHISGLDFTVPKLQVLKALSGQTPQFGDWEDESNVMQKLYERITEHGNQSTLGHYYCSKLTMLFYFGKYRDVIDVSNEGRVYFPFLVGQWVVVEWEFFNSIAIAAQYPKFTANEKKTHIKTFKKSLKQMKKWAEDCPENFDSYYFLMLAELSAIEGKFEETLTLFKDSIKAASKSGFRHIEAIANQRAAMFLLQRGYDKMAESFLKTAWDLFQDWGAQAVCKDLQIKYPLLLSIDKTELASRMSSDNNSLQTIGTVNLVLDLGTILKASQSLASHVKLDELLQNLMYIVIENAGADRGCLLLNRNGVLSIEAIGNSGPEGNQILGSMPYSGSQLVPESLINYCWRVEGNIVVPNAQKDDTYRHDEYVIQNNILSMLCIPITEKGIKIGLLYLENKLLEGVFTKNRLDLLTMLSGQIGISIQNALLYENLEEKVQERTLEISKQQLKIEEEMKRSDALLLNILPAKTAHDLKTKGYTKAIKYPNAHVMFFDIVGFTKRVEKMQAEEIVEEIHELFSGMDDIVSKYKIEKIKTIGDAYMCVSGLNEVEDPNAAINTIEAAKEVLILLEKLNQEKINNGKSPLQLRVGINSGAVIAGVVGKSKFSYDIWGDTVNLAARMETAGELGKINISYNTYIQVKDHYACISRGKLEAKNKGFVEMFFIEG